MKNHHEFAFYYPTLTLLLDQAIEKELTIQDADLVHRIERVLRLKKAEEFILFDQYNHAKCLLEQFVNRKTIRIRFIDVAPNRPITPELVVWLPLLKRDDLHEAVYSLVELGVNSIRLLITSKVQRAWGGAKEMERLHRICIAAAEQSKNYAFAQLHEPINFEQFIAQRESATSLLFFDVNGRPFLETLQNLSNQHPSKLEIILGPEADLSSEEKEILRRIPAITSALTPTILRAREAVTVGVGAVRSVLR